MKLFQLSIATALFVMFLATPHANADFLGLVPGDYAVTLSGTSAACGDAAAQTRPTEAKSQRAFIGSLLRPAECA